MRAALSRVAVMLAGCASSEQLVRNRAAVDLSCPAEQLRLQPAEPLVLAADGCGHHALYAAGSEGRQLARFDGQSTARNSEDAFAPLRVAVPP